MFQLLQRRNLFIELLGISDAADEQNFDRQFAAVGFLGFKHEPLPALAQSFSDDQVGIIKLRQSAHDLRDPVHGQLARSASATCVVHQTLFTTK